ncbi:MAG: elongation factor G [Salinivirgaceae bacterium]|nr:elongation factor G [Salinivirgaceae bacterium]
MKVFQPDEFKNIALIGSAGSGKTTLAEAMLFLGGVVSRRGDVESKNTCSDYRQIEHEQGRSVYSTVLHTEFQNKKLNIIDTPGLDDFNGQVVSSLTVSDSSLLIINSQQGLEVGTELVCRITERMKKPMVIALNQLDHEKTNYEKTVEELKAKFGNKAIIVQYPLTTGTDFNSVIDVLKMKMYTWKPEGGSPTAVDIPAEEMDKANEYRNILVEAAAENDENLMELFFETGSLTEDQMRQGIRKGLIARSMFPIFCISAKRDMGIRRLTEFLNNCAPVGNEVEPYMDTEGNEHAITTEGPVSLFVFKTSVEEHIGEVCYFKVVTGTLKEGMDLINRRTGNKERFTQINLVAGKNRNKISEIVAGDIGAVVKLKECKTNDTFSEKEADWTFVPIKLPLSKFRTAVKAVNESDDEKLAEIIHRISSEDPSIKMEMSKELRQMIVHGQGEFHLNTMKWQVENIFKVPIEFIKPRIPYRETITKAAQADFKHKKQSGGAGQFGEVHLVIEPYFEGMPNPKSYNINGKEVTVSVRGMDEHILPWGGKLVFVNSIVGGSIDARFLPAILKGLLERMERGPLTGSYARDIRVIVYDGKMHPVDSNEISFKIAGSRAFSAAFRNANPKIMEPVYKVEVLVPSEYMGDVMGDLQTRRAMIEGMNNEGGHEKIIARVPLAEMNKYSTSLSSITSGKAMYSMEFIEYAPVPGDIQEKLLKAYADEEEE